VIIVVTGAATFIVARQFL